MAKQGLYYPDIIPSLEQMGGKGVAEGVRSDPFGDFCLADSGIERLLQF